MTEDDGRGRGGRGMTSSRPDGDVAEGAAAPEPSLVARMARSDAEGATVYEDDAANAGSASPVGLHASEPAMDEDAGQHLREGSATAPRDGRVDAAAATLGRHAGEPGSFAAGEGISSVGGAQGDVPGSGVVDQPERGSDAPQRRAGFLEGEGGRRGVATSEGELYDDMGGSIRSAAEVAAGDEPADDAGEAARGRPGA